MFFKLTDLQMRCVVEGEKVTTASAEDEESESSEEDEGAAPGRVYRIFKAGLQKLDGGMSQYETLVEKALAKRKK